MFLGSRTVIHPKARIIADAGPIIIGEGNLIEERAEIINRQVSSLFDMLKGTSNLPYKQIFVSFH
jgi:hypothetical protein